MFTNIITNSIKNYTPIRKNVNNKIHKNPVSWWDSECDKVFRIRTAKFKKWKFTKTTLDHIEYKKAAATATRLFKKKKRDDYKKFSQTINFNTNKNYVWNKSRILKNKWVNGKPSHNSENHQTQDIIRVALDKISPPWCVTDPKWMPTCNDNEFLESPFSFLEFNVALESKNAVSACGTDGIDYEILQRLPLKYKLLLLDIFNEMYKKGEYPKVWNASFVHFINKPDAKSVRPISLTSCVCKLFETLLKNKFQFWLERENILPKSQSGFRRGQCTVDNLTNLLLTAEESFSLKKDLHAAFLDVTGAFDNVIIEVLLERLASIGCPSRFVNFIKFLTYERTIFTNDTGESFRKAYRGVPQGGVLSPLLYCIYVSNILDDIPKSVQVSQFADDIALYCNRSTTTKSKRLLEKTIDIVHDNLCDLGLAISPQKTVYVHFNKRNIQP